MFTLCLFYRLQYHLGLVCRSKHRMIVIFAVMNITYAVVEIRLGKYPQLTYMIFIYSQSSLQGFIRNYHFK